MIPAIIDGGQDLVRVLFGAHRDEDAAAVALGVGAIKLEQTVAARRQSGPGVKQAEHATLARGQLGEPIR